MPKESYLLAEEFGRNLRALERTRINIVNLRSNGLITQRALLHLYEGLFLNAHVLFEGFIENLFVGILVDNIYGLKSSRTDIVARVKVKSHKVARDMIIGPGKTYVDWLPYERTINLAKIYFRGGRPFTDLVHGQITHINNCTIIRNAIAHRSKSSYKRFEDRIIGPTPLPPRERKPSGYLSGLFRINQTRYENIVAQLLIIARHIAR